jgi:predicted Rossmann-fold nucleotide-binding protein
MPHPSPHPEHGAEVAYERQLPVGQLPPGTEVTETAELEALLDAGASLSGLRLQGMDLTVLEGRLLDRSDVAGLVVLGGRLTPELDEHLRTHGAIIFPADPRTPVRPYRGRLYTAEELYEGLEEYGYGGTLDARAYAWFRDARLRHDVYVTALRALHDDAMADALAEVVEGQQVVGVMGGHALRRDSEGYARAAHLGHDLAEGGYLVATGGGPGAMEAANLGAWCRSHEELDTALETMAPVPHFVPSVDDWVRLALSVRRGRPDEPGTPVRSIGIPTWHYGHEPPNVFPDLIAKFFSNALREDLLLHHSTSGLVVLPGAAGTVQEVFQMATRLYYEVDGRVPTLVLVGARYWTEELPVWPLLRALARDRRMEQAIHLVGSTDEAVAALAS